MKFFLVLTILAIFLTAPSIYSQVQYPVQELGNCASQQDCEKYCDDIQNSESCITFAEKSGIMTKEEVDEARKMLPYLKSGETPGKCNSEKKCEEYCNQDGNLQECITFAEKSGLITGEELAMIKKTGGKGPGGCKGKKQCDSYCEDESHFSECVDFAVKYGMMDAKEAEMVKKTGGKGPGGCKSKEACDAFCNDESNIAICVDFAVQNGMMDAKDAEMVKKTGGKGPGNCKSKEECDNFCNNPANQETCTNFAIEHNLLSGEELEKMKKNKEFMNSEEGKCTMQCLKESGVDSRACGENGVGPEACKTCGEKCFPHNEKSGNCLSQEEWQKKDQECKNNGEGYYLEDIRGDSGLGGECVIDMKCVQGNFQQQGQSNCEDCASKCESRPGQRVRGTDCVNNQCQCFYEDEQQEQAPQQQPGEQNQQPPLQSQEQIQQSPQQQPQNQISQVEQVPQQEQQQEVSPSTENSNGGEQVAGTGMVIMESNSDGIITRLIEYIKKLF